MAPTSTATSANFVPRTTRSVAYPHLDARKLRALHALHRRQTLTPTGPLYAHRIPNPLLPSAPIVTPNTRLPVQLAIILGGAGFVALILAASLGYLFYRRRASALARQISTDLDHISWSKAFLTQNSRNISTKEKEPSLTVCQIPSCPSSLSRLSHEKHRESHCGSVDGPFHEIQLDAPLPLFDQRSMPVFETSSIVFTRSSSSSSSSTLPSESSHQSSLMTLGNTEPNLNVFFVANGTQGVDYADEEVFEVRRAETQSLEVMKAVLLTSVDSKHAKEKNNPVPRLAISAPSEPLPLPLPTAPSPSNVHLSIPCIPYLLVTEPSIMSFSTFQSTYSTGSLHLNDFPSPPNLLASSCPSSPDGLAIPKPSYMTVFNSRDFENGTRKVLDDMFMIEDETGQCSVVGGHAIDLKRSQ